MIQIVLIIYNLIWSLLRFFAPIITPDGNIGRWLTLHKDVQSKSQYQDTTALIIFACSSVGEYKRIETIAQRYAQLDYTIEISFFSPSGYSFIKEEAHNWNRITLLPIDQKSDVDKFLKSRKPTYIVISSNMIWPNFIRGLDMNRIPYSIAGCSFNPESFFLQRLFLQFRLHLIGNVEYTFCIDDTSGALLSKYLTPDKIIISGDPRLDSILRSHKSLKGISTLSQFKGTSKLLVVGSAYNEEVKIIIRSIDILKRANYKVLIAPHELDHTNEMLAQFEAAAIPIGLYSKERLNNNVLFLDAMGILKGAYALAEIAFIGGGWRRGIHNIVEAMVHECLIVSGPNYYKFPEARFLTQRNILNVLKKSDSLEATLLREQSKSFAKQKLQYYNEWLELNKYANKLIIDTIDKRLQL